MKIFLLNSFLLLLIICKTTLFGQDTFPEWAKGIVWYQIFPERFSNGDFTNDPTAEKVFINRNDKPQNWQVSEWTGNWFEHSVWQKEISPEIKNTYHYRRYGGDIQGIINKLDYLNELGIKGIYLNPVFEAVSMHKYDGSTFHHIDVNFGPDPEGDLQLIANENPADPSTWVWTSADKLFLKLIEEVHKRDMRIIIDGVFNHVGEQFWAFKDLAEKQQDSKYADWFIVYKFDDPSTEKNDFHYKGWWDLRSLPEFNRSENDLHPAPKEYIFNATRRWMDPYNNGDVSKGIDGWRLDVARDVPIGFWKDWNKHVKSINPDAILIGELWELSDDFIGEDGVFDALMNYNFAYAVNNYFIADKRKIKTSEFVNQLKQIDKTYPEKTLHILQNLLSSHDTDRLSSMIMNPDRNYDRDANENNPNYNPAKPTEAVYEIQKQIASFKMTYRGAPKIYYGDEVGMWGADDPHCRKPMLWDELNYEDETFDEKSGFGKGFGSFSVEPNIGLFQYYKKLIEMRNKSKALLYGDLNFVLMDDSKETFAFTRNYEEETVLAVFNTGKEVFNYKLPLEIDYNKFEFMITEIPLIDIDGMKHIKIAPNETFIIKF